MIESSGQKLKGKTCPKFSIFPFFKMQNDNVPARLSKEEYFIKIYKPKLNVK